MTFEDLKHHANSLSIWKKGDERAPHKPLLILYALGQLENNQRELPYSVVKERLKDLLIDFGPQRKSYHPEEPFVRLQKDGIWELSNNYTTRNPSNKFLIENQAHGKFPDSVASLLLQDKNKIKEIAELVLNGHFPETMHEDILNAVGLKFEAIGKRIRDTRFREKILRAYEYKCAICGFNVRLGNSLIAVEAAHIKWHTSAGPDTEENGIALCALHHKLFDRGVFTLNRDLKVLVSENAHGNDSFKQWLMNYHGLKISKPIHPNYRPNEDYINWHVKEVFKGYGRYFSESH